MHAVVVRVNIDPARTDEAVKMLNEAVVPMAKQAAGFRSGVWTKTADGTKGASIEVFESEKDARAYADAAQAPPDAAVTFDSVEVMEVMASA